MVRRTKQEAEETRARILDAAERVFHEKGVAHASLEDVAAAAQVTRGAIYWHFKDKGELFDAMMQRVMLPPEAIEEGAECPLGQATSLAQLKAAMLAVLERTASDKHMQRIFEIAYHKCEYVGDAVGVRERHVASQAECMKTIEQGFRACVASGELPASVDAKVAAMGAMSLVSGVISNWVLDPGRFALRKHAATLVDIYFRGLESAPRPAARRKAPRKDAAHAPAAARR